MDEEEAEEALLFTLTMFGFAVCGIGIMPLTPTFLPSVLIWASVFLLISEYFGLKRKIDFNTTTS